MITIGKHFFKNLVCTQKIKIKNLVLHPVKLKLGILQALTLSHVEIPKMVSLVIITSVVIKSDG